MNERGDKQTCFSVAQKGVCHLRMSAAGKNLTDHPALPAPPLLASEHPRGEVIFQENRWLSQGWERTPRPPVALSAQPSAPAQVAKAGRPFWQLPAWQGKQRKTCPGAAVLPLILTLQRPLIKIPLGVERARRESRLWVQRAAGASPERVKRVPGVEPAPRPPPPIPEPRQAPHLQRHQALKCGEPVPTAA